MSGLQFNGVSDMSGGKAGEQVCPRIPVPPGGVNKPPLTPPESHPLQSFKCVSYFGHVSNVSGSLLQVLHVLHLHVPTRSAWSWNVPLDSLKTKFCIEFWLSILKPMQNAEPLMQQIQTKVHLFPRGILQAGFGQKVSLCACFWPDPDGWGWKKKLSLLLGAGKFELHHDTMRKNWSWTQWLRTLQKVPDMFGDLHSEQVYVQSEWMGLACLIETISTLNYIFPMYGADP